MLNFSIRTVLKQFVALLCIAHLFSDTSLAQIQIPYSNPEIHARERSGQVPSFRGHLEDQGHLVIDRRKQEIRMISSNGSVRTFSFFHWEHLSGIDHVIGYGDGIAFTFVHYDRFFAIMYKRNHSYVFPIRDSEQVTRMYREFTR